MKTNSNILVIDDEKVVCESFKSILTKEGYNVETRISPSEGLDRAISHKYNLVFLDLKMEEIDGIELFHRIREKAPDLPVVIVTGYPSLDTALECIKLRAADYIIKPFTPDDILKLTRQIIPEISPVRKDNKGKLAEKAVYHKWEPSNKPVTFHETAWMMEGTDGTVRVGCQLPGFIADNIRDVNPLEVNDIAYHGLPIAGVHLTYESKIVIPSPVSGRIIDINPQLPEDPTLVSGSSFEERWIARIEPTDLGKDLLKTQKRNIVVLSKSPDKMEQLTAKLRELGYGVEYASTFIKAANALRNKCFKVIFIHAESISPAGRGYIEQFKTGFPDLKVVAMGNLDAEQEKALRSNNILYYCPSPFDKEEVVDILHSLFTSSSHEAPVSGPKYHGVLPPQISRIHITNKYGKKVTLLIFGELLHYHKGIGSILINKLLEGAYPLEVTRGMNRTCPDAPTYQQNLELEKEHSDVIITLQAKEINKIPGLIYKEAESFKRDGLSGGKMINLVIQPNNDIKQPLVFNRTTTNSIASWLLEWMTTPLA